MKKITLSGARVFPLTLFGIILLAVLILVTVGTQVYKMVVEAQVDSDERRAGLSYLSARVRAADVKDSVLLREGPEGTALVLLEEDSDGSVYETRIYLYEGRLVEEYAMAGGEFSPDNAVAVAETESFLPVFTRDNLLEITTDQGTVKAALRTVDAGAGGVK